MIAAARLGEADEILWSGYGRVSGLIQLSVNKSSVNRSYPDIGRMLRAEEKMLESCRVVSEEIWECARRTPPLI
jgi:hypothetical protein